MNYLVKCRIPVLSRNNYNGLLILETEHTNKKVVNSKSSTIVPCIFSFTSCEKSVTGIGAIISSLRSIIRPVFIAVLSDYTEKTFRSYYLRTVHNESLNV